MSLQRKLILHIIMDPWRGDEPQYPEMLVLETRFLTNIRIVSRNVMIALRFMRHVPSHIKNDSFFWTFFAKDKQDNISLRTFKKRLSFDPMTNECLSTLYNHALADHVDVTPLSSYWTQALDNETPLFIQGFQDKIGRAHV